MRAAAAAAAPRRTAVLLMNLGGPENVDAVRPFLTNLFSDRDLIPLPFQNTLAHFIARRRTPAVQQLYRNIGGGSPILHWTSAQGSLLARALNSTTSSHTAQHASQHGTRNASVSRVFTPYIAFRYTQPSTAAAVAAMLRDGIQDAVVLTLYPQYSCSTTGSSLNELARQIKLLDPDRSIRWSIVDRYAANTKLADVIADHIIECLDVKYPSIAARRDTILLFSAHSLPMTVVNRGDPYPGEVAATVARVMEQLPQRIRLFEQRTGRTLIGGTHPYTLPHRIVWQSQVGPQPWLGPQLEKTIEGYAKQKRNNLLVIPVAFVSDHIETLSEIDREYGSMAVKLGVKGFHRAESLNSDPRFIAALEDVVRTHLAQCDNTSNHATSTLLTSQDEEAVVDSINTAHDSNNNVGDKRPGIWNYASYQYQIRCPGCTSESCIQARELFCDPELNSNPTI